MQTPEPEKSTRRRHLRSLLCQLGDEDVARWSARIVTHLAAWLPPRPLRLAVFSALPGEPDLRALAQGAPAAVLCYPLVRGTGFALHAVADPATLVSGSFGILEPDPVHHPRVAIEAIDTFLCPGLGFAPDGTRLGRGKGYYDRTLARANPASPRVGVGFALQTSAQLPCETYDVRMTHLADENGVRPALPPSAS